MEPDLLAKGGPRTWCRRRSSRPIATSGGSRGRCRARPLRLAEGDPDASAGELPPPLSGDGEAADPIREVAFPAAGGPRRRAEEFSDRHRTPSREFETFESDPEGPPRCPGSAPGESIVRSSC